MMKINPNDPAYRLKKALDRIESGHRAPQNEKPGNLTSPSAGTDRLALSANAQELQKLRDEIDSSPDVRQALVDRVKEEIASGRYNIDGVKIADALLKEE